MGLLIKRVIAKYLHRAVTPVLQVPSGTLHVARVADIPCGEAKPVVHLPATELAATALGDVGNAEIAIADVETVEADDAVVAATDDDIAPDDIRPLHGFGAIDITMQVDSHGVGIDGIVGSQRKGLVGLQEQHVVAIDETERVGAERQVAEYALHETFARVAGQAVRRNKVRAIRAVGGVLLHFGVVGEMPVDVREVVRDTPRLGIIRPAGGHRQSPHGGTGREGDEQDEKQERFALCHTICCIVVSVVPRG